MWDGKERKIKDMLVSFWQVTAVIKTSNTRQKDRNKGFGVVSEVVGRVCVACV